MAGLHPSASWFTHSHYAVTEIEGEAARGPLHRSVLHCASATGPGRRRAGTRACAGGGARGLPVRAGAQRVLAPARCPARGYVGHHRPRVRGAGRARRHLGVRVGRGPEPRRRRQGRLAGGGHGEALRPGDQGGRVGRAGRAGRRARARGADVDLVVRDRSVLGARRGEGGAAGGLELPAARGRRRQPRGRLAAHRAREQVLRRHRRDGDHPAAGPAAPAVERGVGRRVER